MLLVQEIFVLWKTNTLAYHNSAGFAADDGSGNDDNDSGEDSGDDGDSSGDQDPESEKEEASESKGGPFFLFDEIASQPRVNLGALLFYT